jgi:hypothetical protein
MSAVTGSGSFELSPSRRRAAWLMALLVAAALAASAFWVTLRPPLQDLPQHLAAARVLLDREHAGFRFDELYTVDWLRSQYLGTYVLLGALFYPLRLFTDEPLLWASRVLLTLLALAWPLSFELLYRRLGRRAGLGAFTLVFFFNAHLILGFTNFLLGIIACALALACLSGARSRQRSGNGAAAHIVGWGAACFACFYFHVVPFGLLAGVLAGCAAQDLAAILLSRSRAATTESARRSMSPWLYVAFLPALLAALAWMFTPAGVSAREAAQGAGARGRATYQSVLTNWAELETWLTSTFASPWDTRLARAALGLLATWMLLELARAIGLLRRSSEAAPASARAGDPGDRWLLWLLRACVPINAAMYFVLPSSYDWIWPINARFPLLALLFLPFWLPAAGAPAPAGLQRLRALSVGALLLLAAAQGLVARQAFAGFAGEMRGFDDLLANIPAGRRTAALIYGRGSRHVGFAPFLHVGSYYQAERGGVAFFSFADFPQSPVRFRPEQRPPRVPPRWEWMPERVKDRDLAWFDFVITRGGPGKIARSKLFEPVGQFGAYRLFRRRDPIAP